MWQEIKRTPSKADDENVRSKLQKAKKYVEMEQKNWSIFDIKGIDIADL